LKSILITLLMAQGLSALAMTNPHGPIRIDCEVCHVESSWSAVGDSIRFDHSTTGFALTQMHVRAACRDCHEDLTFAGAESDCSGCHKDPHFGQLGTECGDCHDPSSWMNRDRFERMHSETLMPLTEAHASLDCDACHRDPLSAGFIGTPSDCSDCHLADLDKIDDPDHGAAGFSSECLACHDRSTWASARFDHDLTGFPLTDGHDLQGCLQCHALTYAGTSSDCVDCHFTDYQESSEPAHEPAGFPTDCLLCHSTTRWENSDFDHNATDFPLTDAHENLLCLDCHMEGYISTPTDCVACHQADYDGSANPSHVAEGFSTLCADCHTTSAWQPADFDHDTTAFPLTGAHAAADCLACHASGYAGTPSDCVTCHQADYDGASDPDHAAAGFPSDCTVCHTTSAWQPADWDHDSFFPLTGAHATADCLACHGSGYAGTPSDCVACHQADYDGASDPDHAAAGFPSDCATCHTTSAWQPADWEHDYFFPLTGAHASADCLACHASGYAGTPSDCVACHQADYDGASDPDHAAAGFPSDCATCHTTSAWQPADWDHDYFFPLTGAHATADCLACHGSGYAGTPSDCVACHQADYDGASDPDHAAAGFPSDCTVCHTTSAWQPADWDHDSFFPLTGAHATADCLACHGSGYAGTPSDCVACHQADYDGASDPDHAAAGFPSDCAICHTTSAWQPADFDHDTTAFPLTGAHLALACLDCHASGYAGTPSDCVACHQADYDGTSDPDHAAAGFPSDCATCHTTSAWQPADWDHDSLFPIYSGKHRNEWNDCADCHLTPSDYSSFECIFCHEHSQSETDHEHDEVSGYIYLSTACYECHPSGEGGD